MWQFGVCLRVPGRECVQVVDRRLFIKRGEDGVQDAESMDPSRRYKNCKAKTSLLGVPGRGFLFGRGSVKISVNLHFSSPPISLYAVMSLCKYFGDVTSLICRNRLDAG